MGFAYSLELLVKCDRLNFKIVELPAQWEERSIGESRFKIFKWLRDYLKWYFYGLKTFWLKTERPINLSNKDWMKKKYLITGGTGFIGSNIVKQLVRLKKKVVIYDNDIRGQKKTLKIMLNL